MIIIIANFYVSIEYLALLLRPVDVFSSSYYKKTVIKEISIVNGTK
jgi:hypothetical protein